MKPKLLLGLALVLSGGLFGCSMTKPQAKWPVFYDSEKGPVRISISREPQPFGFYTNDIPDWNTASNPSLSVASFQFIGAGTTMPQVIAKLGHPNMSSAGGLYDS